MVSDIILAGSGGCMREIVWQIQELNKQKRMWNILGYVDDAPSDNGTSIFVGMQELCYLGNDDYLLHQSEQINAAICVGSPSLRKKIAGKLMQNPNIRFPSLILSDTKICQDAELGKGCIVSMGASISTNVSAGDFVFLNTGSMVCHDGKIGDYVTLGPDVKLAGTVSIGSNCELGIGTKVIQGIKISADVVTGAGSIVIHDIREKGTYAGVPARQLGFN